MALFFPNNSAMLCSWNQMYLVESSREGGLQMRAIPKFDSIAFNWHFKIEWFQRFICSLFTNIRQICLFHISSRILYMLILIHTQSNSPTRQIDRQVERNFPPDLHHYEISALGLAHSQTKFYCLNWINFNCASYIILMQLKKKPASDEVETVTTTSTT